MTDEETRAVLHVSLDGDYPEMDRVLEGKGSPWPPAARNLVDIHGAH